MAEGRKVLRLGRGSNGFFCPETRLHLMGGIKPQAELPAGVPLSASIKRGLLGGNIVDVLGNITKAELGLEQVEEETKAPVVKPQTPVDETSKKEADVSKTPDVPLTEDPGKENEDEESHDEDELSDEEVYEDEIEDEGAKGLTEEDVYALPKKDLEAFMKEQKIELADLGLNSRAKIDKLRKGLATYLGYEG